MATDLKYNINSLQTNAAKIEKSRDYIEKRMKTIHDAIDELKPDWVTLESSEFFSKVDNEWMLGVQATLEMLDDLKDAIDSGRLEYEKIEPEANAKLKY